MDEMTRDDVIKARDEYKASQKKVIEAIFELRYNRNSYNDYYPHHAELYDRYVAAVHEYANEHGIECSEDDAEVWVSYEDLGGYNDTHIAEMLGL